MKNKKNIWKHFVSIGLVIALALVCNITEYTIAFAEPTTAKVSYKIEKKQQIKRCKKLTAQYFYELPQIKGNSSAIKKINKSLAADYKASLQYRNNLFEYYELLKKSSYKKIYYINKCNVTYNQNGYISFRFVSKWYAGGVGENREYGLTYRLKDRKKLAVQDVASGKKSNVKKNIATAYSKKFSGQGYSYVMKMKYSDFQFYIKPGKKVFVCFGPYGALGAHGKVVVEIKGRL